MPQSFPTTAPIEGLHDIVIPAAVSMAPTTVGWLVAVVLAAMVAIWVIWRIAGRARANRYRHQALAQLDAIARETADLSQRGAALTRVAPLLKRTALSVFPRREVAPLSGEPWLEFLDETGGGVGFTNGVGQSLLAATYGVSILDDEQSAALLAACRRWIRHHKRPPKPEAQS